MIREPPTHNTSNRQSSGRTMKDLSVVLLSLAKDHNHNDNTKEVELRSKSVEWWWCPCRWCWWDEDDPFVRYLLDVAFVTVYSLANKFIFNFSLNIFSLNKRNKMHNSETSKNCWWENALFFAAPTYLFCIYRLHWIASFDFNVAGPCLSVRPSVSPFIRLSVLLF